MFKHNKLKSYPYEVKLYRSKDEDDAFNLNTFHTPALLGLKVNCPVMLIVNLSDTLLNGTKGTIISMSDLFIAVYC
jgi:hypothetical protein